MSITDAYAVEMRTRHAERKRWGGTGGKYGGADVVGLLDRFPKLITVLDYGSGKGELEKYVVERLQRKDVIWTNYDPGIPGIDKLSNDVFDMVITTDVLEHVEEALLSDTLDEIAERTGTLMYHNIACTTTGRNFKTGPYAGQDVHILVREPDWWHDAFDMALGDNFGLWEYKNCLRRAKRGQWRERATLIYERGA